MQAPIPISGTNIAVQFFTLKYLIGDSVCDSRVIDLNSQACIGDVCNVTSVISDSNCIIETDLDVIVTVSATSDLGTGQESQSARFGKHLATCMHLNLNCLWHIIIICLLHH